MAVPTPTPWFSGRKAALLCVRFEIRNHGGHGCQLPCRIANGIPSAPLSAVLFSYQGYRP